MTDFTGKTDAELIEMQQDYGSQIDTLRSSQLEIQGELDNREAQRQAQQAVDEMNEAEKQALLDELNKNTG